MSKDDQSILVVPTELLFLDGSFQGFQTPTTDYEARILDNSRYIRRGSAEEDPTFKQPIAYCTVVNPGLKQVFAYQRSKLDPDYPEKRLQGKWSWGVGGHIEQSDGESENPIQDSMLRELEEEIDGLKNPQISVLGYINYDQDEVSQVHFGILYLVQTDSQIILPKDPEMAHGKFRRLNELEEICETEQVEAWSEIALQPLKEQLR
ncbi:hypothetical protein CL618_00840 [archaeon]|nr:hypothetical protein [archaeon]|tara:strand:+ start:3409 stop:4026 length:618 start_codon:yes stop_codon:yes gene_type:complete